MCSSDGGRLVVAGSGDLCISMWCCNLCKVPVPIMKRFSAGMLIGRFLLLTWRMILDFKTGTGRFGRVIGG